MPVRLASPPPQCRFRPPPLPHLPARTESAADWTLADVVDFEHFLAADAPDAHPADPRITRALQAAPGERRPAFRAWLEVQRERHAGAPTPGRRLAQGLALMSTAAMVSGALLGASLAGAWMARAGNEPVNAPLFWAVTVGMQLLLLAIAVPAWALRRRVGATGGLPAAMQALMVGAASAMRRLPGEPRDALRAALARLATRQARHGHLLAAPAAALLQRFAVAFNAGLLAAMLALHLPLVDLRFGWQSTYPIDASQMHRAVQAVAAPWGWAVPDAHPDAAEVAATRYARGQPAHTLPADASRAWWPFLALSIACYGLLLRALLWAGLAALQRRRLRTLAFDAPEAHALWRRLTGPLVRAEGGTAQLPAGTGAAVAMHPRGDCVVLVAQELTDDPDTLRGALQSSYGCQPSAWHRIAIDDRHAAAPVLAELAGSRPRSVFLLAPAARDPIVAVAQLLRAVADAAAPGAELLLLLSAADTPRLAIWRRFVQIQRLPIGVEALA
jgi:hypothetical protein